MYLYPEIVDYDEHVSELNIKLENTGSKDEEGLLHIKCEGIGYEKKIKFKLDEGSSRWLKQKLYNPPAGTHNIIAEAAYDRYSISKTIQLTVKSHKAEQVMPAKTKGESAVNTGQSAQKEQNKAKVFLPKTKTVSKSEYAAKKIMTLALITLATLSVLFLGYWYFAKKMGVICT